MQILYMIKGIPGSGKTTLAKEMQKKNKNLIRVNKDELRSMLHGGEWTHKNEKQILKIRNMIIVDSLTKGKSVIVDDTNFAPRHEKKLREISKIYGAEFKIIDLTDVSPELCIKRDLKRSNSVGSQVIYRMYNKYIKNKEPQKELNPLIFDKTLPNCVVFDLDGTLAHINNRSPYDGKSCANDTVNESIASLFRWASSFVEIIILSGRSEDSKAETETWLKTNNFNPKELHMRKLNDSRKDSIIKKELFDEYIKDKYNVVFVVDDRQQVVDLWRSLGLTCLQCAEGNF